jgi:4'-phosphopantetheinyl transferase
MRGTPCLPSVATNKWGDMNPLPVYRQQSLSVTELALKFRYFRLPRILEFASETVHITLGFRRTGGSSPRTFGRRDQVEQVEMEVCRSEQDRLSRPEPGRIPAGLGFERKYDTSMQAGCSFEITARDVHVWTVRTAVPDGLAARFHSLLDPGEAARAAQFRIKRFAESFVVARGVLRHLLGRYLDCDPACLRFEYGSKGKPAVEQGNGIQFNLSHSGDLAAIAVTFGCEIGVDLERLRPVPEMDQIASQYFDPYEAAEIISLPEKDRERFFFRSWTRKEAYIKAIGEGLSESYLRFSLASRPGTHEFRTNVGADAMSELWSLHDLEPAPDYLAAVAFRDRQRTLSLFPIFDAARLWSVPKREAGTESPVSFWQPT